MDPHLSQWLNLALRWAHVITGIAWIGTSFYFNWLNSRIAPPERDEPDVQGDLWSVHGGAFYRTVKYQVAPGRLPRTLRGAPLVFAMNAGMYHADRSPVGLYVEEGKTLRQANTRDGSGNFHLKPNGVFYVAGEEAGVLTTERFLAKRPREA